MLVEQFDLESGSLVGRSSGVLSLGCRLATTVCRLRFQLDQPGLVAKEGRLLRNLLVVEEHHTVLAEAVLEVHPIHVSVPFGLTVKQNIVLALHRQEHE